MSSPSLRPVSTCAELRAWLNRSRNGMSSLCPRPSGPATVRTRLSTAHCAQSSAAFSVVRARARARARVRVRVRVRVRISSVAFSVSSVARALAWDSG